MSFIAEVASSIHRFLWDINAQDQTSQPTPEEGFKNNLLKYSAMPMSLEECITNCCNCVKEVLSEPDCDLSETHQKEIKFYLANFNKEVDRTFVLDINQSGVLKAAFQDCLGDVFKEKWIAAMAKAFYSISTMDNYYPKIFAMEKWSQQFFVGVDYFSQWENNIAHRYFVSELMTMLAKGFVTYSDKVKQKKIETITAQAEKNLNSFNKDQMESLKEIAAQNKLGSHPDIDKGLDLLKKCIFNQGALRRFKTPAASDKSFQSFARIVNASN